MHLEVLRFAFWGGCDFMKSLVVKCSIAINGHETGVSLEDGTRRARCRDDLSAN
jgi:hypothetical protein